MNDSPLVLMMAGGTGGHVYPALAVAREMQSRGFRVAWVGTSRGLEARVVPEAGIDLHHLVVRGVRGKNPLSKLLGVIYLILASLQAIWLVLRLSPSCVVGMGGYVAGPAGVAAWLLRKPLVIHEQNAVAGTTNRLLAPFAKRVLCGFPSSFSADIDARVVGNPVRSDIIERGATLQYEFRGQRPLRLLVLGGSLGAKPVNDLLPPAVAELADGSAIEVWHQTGVAHAEAVKQAYDKLNVDNIKVAAFIEEMADAYAWADLVVCRAGALTVAELAIMGRPAILVPLPHAIDDHQSANARFLSDPGAAVMIPQSDLTAQALAALLQQYCTDSAALLEMAKISSGLATPGATVTVGDCCEELINERG
jgi:UDP-N-acetylglucosamine--N-acetylmuramyl-(pentapeptide) pyrophosphoryl-undecaprenol N-acetylglucosamine transferase